MQKNIVFVVLRLCMTVDIEDEYGYPTVHKTVTSRLKRYKQFGWKGSEAE